MCLAIYKPKNRTISKEILLYAQTVNPDGIGIAYSDQQGLHVYKTIDEQKTLKLFEIISNNLKNFDVLIHLRYATRGEVNDSNCHPFLNEKKTFAIIHNGTFSGFGSNLKSDTKEFCENLAFPIFAKTGYSQGFMNLMEHFAQSQKLASIDRNGKVIVYNQRSWTEREGILYSNTYSLPDFPKPKRKKSHDPFYFKEDSWDFWKDEKETEEYHQNFYKFQ